MGLKKQKDSLGKTEHLMAVVAVFPDKIGISQKKPFIFEVPVSGKDVKTKFDFLNQN